MYPLKLGSAIAAMVPVMATVVISSTSAVAMAYNIGDDGPFIPTLS